MNKNLIHSCLDFKFCDTEDVDEVFITFEYYEFIPPKVSLLWRSGGACVVI
jgi:hypothetical protein